MQRILTFVTCMTRLCLRSLHHRFILWTEPDTTSLIPGMLIDQARSKSELVAENAFLRKPLIILRRQVKRSACTKTDRMLLVLLASMVRTWATSQQAPHLLAHLEWWRAYSHFVRPHASLRVALVQLRERDDKLVAQRYRQRTPAMAAGRTTRRWTAQEVLSYPLSPVPCFII